MILHGPTITDIVFVVRTRMKMASSEHFKCVGAENVTSLFFPGKRDIKFEFLLIKSGYYIIKDLF